MSREVVDALIAEARERVQAHKDFARYAPTSKRLDGFYENYERLADALESTVSQRDELARMHRECHAQRDQVIAELRLVRESHDEWKALAKTSISELTKPHYGVG